MVLRNGSEQENVAINAVLISPCLMEGVSFERQEKETLSQAGGPFIFVSMADKKSHFQDVDVDVDECVVVVVLAIVVDREAAAAHFCLGSSSNRYLLAGRCHPNDDNNTNERPLQN